MSIDFSNLQNQSTGFYMSGTITVHRLLLLQDKVFDKSDDYL